jgi:hypothetical protein
MGHLYHYESLIGLSLFLTVSILLFGCINEIITFFLKKKKKKKVVVLYYFFFFLKIVPASFIRVFENVFFFFKIIYKQLKALNIF